MNKDLQDRILSTTRGTQTGALIACALGADRDALPRYEGTGIITSHGYVMANFVDRHGEHHSGAFVGPVSDLDHNLVRLREHCKLSPAEYDELTALMAGWISQDYRS